MRQALVVMAMMVGCGKSGTDLAPGVCTGDVTITSSAEMAAFVARGCTSVTGTLSVAGTDLSSFSLPALTSVGGSLNIDDNTALTNFSLPALTKVAVPTTTYAYLNVRNNAALTSFNLPALTSVSALNVSDNSALTAFSLPVLTNVGTMTGGSQLMFLQVSNNTSLTTFSFPALTNISALSVADNPALTSFSLPVLTTMSGSATVVIGRIDGLRVFGNTALTTLSLPALTTVAGDLTITGNTSYPQCAAEAIFAHLTAAPSGSDLSGNDTSATCTP